MDEEKLLTEIYIVFRRADRLMDKGRIEELDGLIAGAIKSEPSTDILLAYLTASLPVKKRLKSRRKLYWRTRKLLKQRGEWEKGILQGLW